jgi:hypothetical protein
MTFGGPSWPSNASTSDWVPFLTVKLRSWAGRMRATLIWTGPTLQPEK